MLLNIPANLPFIESSSPKATSGPSIRYREVGFSFLLSSTSAKIRKKSKTASQIDKPAFSATTGAQIPIDGGNDRVIQALGIPFRLLLRRKLLPPSPHLLDKLLGRVSIFVD
ncbi:MAG: hypothetical protein ACI9NQ_000111 [Paracoccaceae bacterium]